MLHVIVWRLGGWKPVYCGLGFAACRRKPVIPKIVTDVRFFFFFPSNFPIDEVVPASVGNPMYFEQDLGHNAEDGYMAVDVDWMSEQWELLKAQPWFRGQQDRGTCERELRSAPTLLSLSLSHTCSFSFSFPHLPSIFLFSFSFSIPHLLSIFLFFFSSLLFLFLFRCVPLARHLFVSALRLAPARALSFPFPPFNQLAFIPTFICRIIFYYEHERERVR